MATLAWLRVVFGCTLCLCFVSACGGGSGGGRDGGSSVDGGRGEDDDDDDAGSRNSITLIVGEEPLAGIHVTTHDAAGLVLEHLVTDASGILELSVPDGGSFAVFLENTYPDGGSYSRTALQ